MKALFAALLICLGCQGAAAAPCQPAATPSAAAPLEGCDAHATHAAASTRLQKVAVATPVTPEAVGFIAPSAGRTGGSGAPAGHPARDAAPSPFNTTRPVPQPQEPPTDGSRGRSLLLVGLALMAGIALRRYGAEHG